NVAYDTSGVEPSLNLALSGDISWVGGWGINIRGGKAQGSTASSRKIHDLVKATGEYTVEAWVAPANVVQEDAFIVSLSGGTTARNFTLAQDEYNYDFYARSTSTGANGTPVLSTPNAARIAQATLQHVAATYDPVNGRRLYVNGQLVNVSDPVAGGTLTDWNDTFALVLGNEVSGDRPFAGVLRLVAVHNRALSAAQVQQNFGAGVGERFYMLFGVSHLVSVPQSYVMFEVSQFDSYGYLFDKPAFISLDPAVTPSSIRIRGMRIGMNGAEARAGQAYVPMDAVVNGSGYSASKGFPLSSIGTVVALDKGPALDAFFLTFEQIGSQSNPRTEPAPVAPPPPAEGPPVADIGLKTFEELDASMSVMTGVPRSLPEIAATYDRIQQQLPVEADIEGFLSSHQVGLAQLAIEYCNALVDDSTRRAQYFAGFDFAAPAAQAFDTAAERNLVIDPLVARAIGTGIATQPSAAEVRAELDSLITRLASCGLGCAADRTPTVVKSACSAVVGSAATLLQ
ncbi:MAG: LamG domain-containing protein, partial [Gammaproteobacteria bacterium]|nr:LamG domain-containing protein [Gammaproteobacteria bacterium]